MTKRVLMICPDAQMIDRRVLQSANSLAAAGVEVDLVSGMECAVEEHYEVAGVAVHRYAFDWHDPRMDWLGRLRPHAERLVQRGYAWYQRRGQHLRRDNTFDHFVLRKLADFQPDLVYVHDLPFLEYGHRIARTRDVPLVFDTHEIYYEQDTLSAGARKRLIESERKRIRDVDLFLTVNELIAAWYADRYPGIAPWVVYNSLPAFDIPERATARAELERLTGASPSDTIVLYQGWISAERNLVTMVEAVDHIPGGIKLVVVGYGDHVEHLRSVAAGLRQPEAVSFLGRMEQEALLAVTPGADVGLIPYLPIDLNHELCSPNKFFEFVQNEVPVLAHASPFFVAMQERLGVVATGDLSTPESFATALMGSTSDLAALSARRDACARHRGELAWAVAYQPVVDECLRLIERTR